MYGLKPVPFNAAHTFKLTHDPLLPTLAQRIAQLLDSVRQFPGCARKHPLGPRSHPQLRSSDINAQAAGAELLEGKMKHRALIAAGIVLLPITAWTVSKDFNGRMWLAQVPALPSSATVAYGQWDDNGQGALTPGAGFKTVEEGINNVLRDQAQANTPSQSQVQQQMSAAQQMQQKYGTPEGQAALKSMTPDQLMALAQQMMPQNTAHVVSPDDQVQLQKIGNGVYSGQAQVLEGMKAIRIEANGIEAQWDAEAAPLVAQEDAQQRQLPVCPGEASIPSDLEASKLKLEFADKRIKLAGQYLPKFAPLVDKMRATVLPEIDFGDDALAAWTKIQDPGLKQQVSASAHGAEQIGLGDVGAVESFVKDVSQKAAQTIAQKKAIEKQYANAKGCN
jgi:hypothetical protein